MLKRRFNRIRKLWKRLLGALRLSPLSLAVKCQMMFGLAVVLTLVLALILPYIWMQQLVKKGYLDTERARAELLFARHFQKDTGNSSLTPLDGTGRVIDPNNPQIRWVRFTDEKILELEEVKKLSSYHYKNIKKLLEEKNKNDLIKFQDIDGVHSCSYVRLLRANDNCMTCHNGQGPPAKFAQNELIGAILTMHPVSEIIDTNLLNWVWLTTAGLIAGTGSLIAFYWITQRVILRPIRQLRAMANNVAEGNLNIRSQIKTGDEYEKLAGAFNHMLDGLQDAQEKLRNVNTQLDLKISELSARNIELFKANKLKSEFLANISHEFRTPLNAILGFAQVLKEKHSAIGGLSKDKAQRYAENIITGGNRLLNMINDLLELAKTRAGKIELHIDSVSVAQLIDSAVSSFSLETRKKKIKVNILADENLPVLVSDAGKVQQIIFNFLSNAVKFTPVKGKIEIRASQKDEKTLRITVTDTGCGIAEQDKERIFEKFVTADGSLTRESSGTGLGLAISVELASLLAGGIGVESKLGEGSTFWLEIPFTLIKDAAPAAAQT